jgi:hypothetical protein
VVLLPGHPEFVFTMYGGPGELEPLKQLVQVMREHQLGNGFDPGPTPHPKEKPVFDYLAGVGWPVMCYPGCADMQVKGGRCVLGTENEAALAAMDRAHVFSAVQCQRPRLSMSRRSARGSSCLGTLSSAKRRSRRLSTTPGGTSCPL